MEEKQLSRFATHVNGLIERAEEQLGDLEGAAAWRADEKDGTIDFEFLHEMHREKLEAKGLADSLAPTIVRGSAFAATVSVGRNALMQEREYLHLGQFMN